MEPITITLSIVGVIGLIAIVLVLRYDRKTGKNKPAER